MPRPKPLVALHGAVDFSRLIPFDPIAPLSVNDLLVMRREAGGPNLLARVGDVQAHTGGAVDISALTGGVDDDLMYRVAGVWTGTLSSGLKYDGTEMTFTNDGIVMESGAGINIEGGSGISLASGAGIETEDAGEIILGGTGALRGSLATAPSILNVASSASVTNIRPNRADNSGLGQSSTSHFSLIAAGTQVARVRNITNAQFQLKPQSAFQNSPGEPLLQFHNSALGFYSPVANVISMAVLGVQKWSFTADTIQSAGSGGAIRFDTPSAIKASLVVRATDIDTGWGSNAVDELSGIAGGVEAVRYAEVSSNIIQTDQTVVVTASTTQAQGNGALISSRNQVSIVANDNDVVTMPSAALGKVVEIIHSGANILQVFPAAGDNLGFGTNVSITIQPGQARVYRARTSSVWLVASQGFGPVSADIAGTSFVEDGEVSTGTGTIPIDDTIPQISEGDEYMTLSHTPGKANNLLNITVGIYLENPSQSRQTVALFRDAVTDAIACAQERTDDGDPHFMYFRTQFVAPSTSAITFRVRAGADAAGTTTFNGQGGARFFGGALASNISIEEVTPS